jgi:murein DD-endopeptidase MepM/ murein hydrolase activator NlpD
MNLRQKITPTLFVLLLFLPALTADALELEGKLIQGGMLTGRVAPKTTVSYMGRELRISPDGIFVIGFDRDAPLESTLKVVHAAGKEERRKITLQKRTYDIQRIDGLPPKMVTPDEKDLERIWAEAALAKKARERDDPRIDFMTDYIWPVIGRISGIYGSQRILNGKPRRPHYGVDIAAPTGTPVSAPAAGVVSLAHPGMYFSGKTLILDHGHGISSSFLHLSKILVKEGQAVQKGQTIALVGATGRVTGAHLDWRMNWFDKRIDPTLLVPPMPPPAQSQ